MPYTQEHSKSGKQLRRNKEEAHQTIRSALFCLLFSFPILLSGCMNSEMRHGIIRMSQPFVVDGEHLEDTFTVDTKFFNFQEAFNQSGTVQSAAFRRFSNQQRLQGSVSADLLKLQQLQAAAEAGVPPPEGSTTAPALPTGSTTLAPPDGFLSGALADQTVAIPVSDKLMTAFSNNILARFMGDLPFIFSKHRNDYDFYFILSTMTVNPGAWTRVNGIAQLNIDYTLKDISESDPPTDQYTFKNPEWHLYPVFPTRMTANILDDSASLDSFQLLLEALLIYGPAQGNIQYENAINDLKRLVSARQLVTVSGSMIDSDSMRIYVKGQRSADPFGEKRPTGKLILEPVTLPVIQLLAVDRRARLSGKAGKDRLSLALSYSGKWQIRRGWYNPARWLTHGWSNVESTSNSYTSYIDRSVATQPVALTLSHPFSEEFQIKHSADQILLVKGTGSPARNFYLEGVPLTVARSERISNGDRLYHLAVPSSLLTEIAFSSTKSVTDQEFSRKACIQNLPLELTANNDAGVVSLAPITLNYCATVPRNRVRADDQNGPRSVETSSEVPLTNSAMKLLSNCADCGIKIKQCECDE